VNFLPAIPREMLALGIILSDKMLSFEVCFLSLVEELFSFNLSSTKLCYVYFFVISRFITPSNAFRQE